MERAPFEVQRLPRHAHAFLAGAESAEVLGSLRDLHFQVDANKIFTGEKPKHLILVKTRW